MKNKDWPVWPDFKIDRHDTILEDDNAQLTIRDKDYVEELEAPATSSQKDQQSSLEMRMDVLSIRMGRLEVEQSELKEAVDVLEESTLSVLRAADMAMEDAGKKSVGKELLEEAVMELGNLWDMQFSRYAEGMTEEQEEERRIMSTGYMSAIWDLESFLKGKG